MGNRTTPRRAPRVMVGSHPPGVIDWINGYRHIDLDAARFPDRSARLKRTRSRRRADR